jgi:SPP1 gp7 family putative phage head morphogenesis protein
MAKNPWALPDGFDESTKEALRDLFGALRRSRTHITPEALNALKMGNLAAFSALVDWSSIRSEFSNFKTILSAQARRAALEIYKAGGVGSQLTFDLINERAVEYASKRAGELVVAIEGEMRETIRDIITRSTQGEFTVQQAGKFIRANLPLTPKDSNAVLSYADKQYFRFIRDGYSDLKARIKADAMAEKYADKLIRQRATTIARTETAEASMQGVSAGWRSGVETGLIDNSSQKEWIAEADACDICGPMDGKLVPWDAEFPSGRMAPPQHPNCRCSMAILPPDYTDTPFTGQVYNGNKVKVEFEYGNQIRKHLELLEQETFELVEILKADTYTPTEGMKTSAKRALRWKEEGKAKGAGTPVGWGRATDIVAGRSMSLDIVKRMYSFFSRHEVDKKGKDFNNTSEPSNGRIMWDAWGGDAGFRWSKAIVERNRDVEKHLSGQHDQASHGKGKGLSSMPSMDKLKYASLRVVDRSTPETIYSSGTKSEPFPHKITTSTATYVSEDEDVFRLKYEEITPTNKSDWSLENDIISYGKVSYRNENDAEWSDVRELDSGYEGLTWTRFSPTDTSARILTIGVERKYQRQGLATAMLAYARESTSYPIEHSEMLTDEGSAFATVVKNLIKHLAGKHDQTTHGKGGSTSTPLNAKPSVFSELPDFKVTTENVWAVKGYAGNHAAFAINQQLRAGENPQEAKRLQKVIDESPALDSDLTFIRHVDEKALGELATKPMSDWVGKTLVNKGFTSMASNKKSPRSGPFIHDFDYKRNVKINVIAPKGTRGIKGDEFEAEFILSKNSSFTIIGASKIGNETVVDMVVTGQDG